MQARYTINRVVSVVLLFALTVPTLVHLETIAKRKAIFMELYTQTAAQAEPSVESFADFETRMDKLMEATGLMEDAENFQKVKSLFERLYFLTMDVASGKRKVSDTRFMQEADALFKELVKIDTEIQKADGDYALSGKDSFTALAMTLLWDYLDFYEAHFHEPQQPIDGVTVERDVYYTEEQDTFRALDIYAPQHAKTPLPVILDIHGGGLMYGDKKKLLPYASRLAAKGYLVITLNYRLAPAVQYKEQVQDILEAYAFLYDRLESFGGDRNNIYLVGDSAGAQLAYYTYLVGQSDKLCALYETQRSPLSVRAMGLISGMFDMKSGPNSIFSSAVLGYEYKDLPYYPYLQPEEVLPFGKMPPTFVMTEKKDFLRSASVDFARQLTAQGTPCRLRDDRWRLNQSIGHITSVVFPDLPESVRATEDMLDFFKHYAT